jgi:hydrogenase maturation factor
LDAKKFIKEDEMATCPGCESGQLQKTEEQARMGSAATAKVVCNKCGLGFLQEQDRLKLIQLADGASIRYEAKSGSYVPDAAIGNSETKPRHNPQLSEIRPSTIPYANEKTSVVDLMNNSRDSQKNSCGISQEIEIKDQPNESKPTNYVLTHAGKYFLTMDFDRMMEINHLLRCVRDKIELEPDKLKILVEAGLLLDKK